MKDLELSGLWWLPGNEDNKVAGIMSFSNAAGILLKLIGSFKGSTQLMEHHPVILGVTSDAKIVTLFD